SRAASHPISLPSSLLSLYTHPPACSFLFRAPSSTDISTLSLHDALPIWSRASSPSGRRLRCRWRVSSATSSERPRRTSSTSTRRSEEHTSELQSPDHLVCRLLLEKKKNKSYMEKLDTDIMQGTHWST